jgi:5-methylcytosine-specific restriction endonuclease McrA
MLARMREYQKVNHDEIKVRRVGYYKRWYRENKDKALAIKHRRLARKKANGGSFTAAEWRELCRKYDYRCLCCGRLRPLTVDHVIPLYLGGRGDISNIQPLCLECNCRKHARYIDYRPGSRTTRVGPHINSIARRRVPQLFD